jgi:hypothetical protein
MHAGEASSGAAMGGAARTTSLSDLRRQHVARRAAGVTSAFSPKAPPSLGVSRDRASTQLSLYGEDDDADTPPPRRGIRSVLRRVLGGGRQRCKPPARGADSPQAGRPRQISAHI